MSYKLQMKGVVPFPDAEFRREEWDHLDPIEETKQTPSKKQNKLNFQALLSETNTTTNTTPQTPLTPTPKATEETYSPSKPLLLPPSTSLSTLPALLSRIETSQRIRAERDRTPRYTHNGFLLHHILSNAPSTHYLCRRCTPRRKCPHHRTFETFRQETSVSLCQHARLVLTWAVDDPNNDKSTWTLETRTYFDVIGQYGGSARDGGDHYDPRAEEREREKHERDCVLHSEEFRVQLLAERVVEDFRRERKALRGNIRRVADEIRALLGAFQRAEGLRKERSRFGKILGGEVRPVDTTIIPSKEEEQKEGTAPSVSEHELEPRKEVGVAEEPATYIPPSSPLFKRKRSSATSIVSTSTASSSRIPNSTSEEPEPPRKIQKTKSRKTVSWALEVDTNTNVGVERVRMMSPEVESGMMGKKVRVRELLLSPVVSDEEEEEEDGDGERGGEVEKEDEVDYGDE
ncbi:hypothetical protein DM02DRAFT_700381 [Periconia macrospinosa]|uniref:Uncharacterized protein n=1 Tax=Periconia macrospinosa TaxID=97972 RepID=A0A2V1EAI4_9PLEO|nr:hypothetical protein DM02DRAFT_700381 [Periconia macrospinosa]